MDQLDSTPCFVYRRTEMQDVREATFALSRTGGTTTRRAVASVGKPGANAEDQMAMVLVREGSEMHKFKQDCIRRAGAEAEALLAAERARIEETIRGSQREEHQTVAHVRKDRRNFLAHQGSPYRDHIGMAAR